METSCGVVLVNLDSILILQYPQGHWDLPKGHIEKNDENRKQTALRELTEETGISDITWINGFIKKSSQSKLIYIQNCRMSIIKNEWMSKSVKRRQKKSKFTLQR